MSENHSAENHPGSSEANQGAASWYSGWEDFSVPAETDPSPAAEGDFPDPDQQDWHPVDPPYALRVGDLEQPSTTPLLPTEEIPPPIPPIDLPNWSVRTLSPQAPVVDAALPQTPSSEPAEPPLDVTELISLIQELNQCNSALLDRVAQLEDALEQTQARNQAIGQNPGIQGAAVFPAPAPVVSADQVTQLLQELESTHQTSQRQQVLVETLSAQLNSSQERIVQLEGDYTLMQQRLNEQQQKLLQSEQANRDLYIRLQRQQRYTLQFKAALERCLEVSTPPFDLPDMSAASASVSESMLAAMPAAPLTPKVRQIQPWASGSEGNLPPKLDVLRGQPLPTPSPSIPTVAVNDEPAVPAPNIPPAPPPQAISLNEGEPVLAPDLQTSSNALQAAAAELKSVLANLFQPKTEAETAEADVWRDLAKLADVSPDDVARASQTEEVNQFLAPLPPGETLAPKTHLSMPSEVFQAKVSPQGIPHFVPGETGTQGDGTPPSPIVYPFRPLKKLESLAAIDLPSFPRSST